MYSITENGKSLDKSLYTIDEKNKTFSSKRNGLVLDFSGLKGWSFKTGSYCIFKTGEGCSFNTGGNCIFKTGLECIFDTLGDCTFITGEYCIFKTGEGCIFSIYDDFKKIKIKGKLITLTKNEESSYLFKRWS